MSNDEELRIQMENDLRKLKEKLRIGAAAGRIPFLEPKTSEIKKL